VNVTVNSALWSGFSALLLFALVIGVIGASTRRSQQAQDRRLRRDWQETLAATELPPWDGMSWDWPEDGLYEYFFGQDAAEAQDAPDPDEYADYYGSEADAFIAAMQARTDSFIAQLSQPLPVLAGAARE
jgi:hypothetical protein